jgi:cytochrome P450
VESGLLEWMQENQPATRSGDLAPTARVAEDFDDIIRSVLAVQRPDSTDITGELLRVEVHGRPVDRRRDYVGTCATGPPATSARSHCASACWCTIWPAISSFKSRLRDGLPDNEMDLVIDQMLRLDDPFVSSRRVTTCPVDLGGIQLPEGARVKLHWTSANRDEAVSAIRSMARTAASAGDPEAGDPS